MSERFKETLSVWESGVHQFNVGQFWLAHESWEKGWKDLEDPEKQYVQALIQVCAVFYLLIEKSRLRPARALCRAALRKFESFHKAAKSSGCRQYPEIPGVEKVLTEIIDQDLKLEEWKKLAHSLTARIVIE
jgi:hypothetical protein